MSLSTNNSGLPIQFSMTNGPEAPGSPGFSAMTSLNEMAPASPLSVTPPIPLNGASIQGELPDMSRLSIKTPDAQQGVVTPTGGSPPNTTTFIAATGKSAGTVPSKVVGICKIRHDLQEGYKPILDSNGMTMNDPHTGQMRTIKFSAPIFLKISPPLHKDVPKKNAPGQSAQVGNQMVALQQGASAQGASSPGTKYWEIPPIYNYGTPESPIWGELVYTFETDHPVWFNGITEEVQNYEGGGSKTKYRTSCRFPQNEEKCRELVLAHDRLYKTFASALCVGGVNNRVGLVQLDPNNPKDAEIKPLLYQKKDEHGNPLIGKDPLKFFNLAVKGGKIGAVFKRPRIDSHDGMLFKTDGRNLFKYNPKTGLIYACDKAGNFLQIDHTTNQPIPTTVSGNLVPEYQIVDPTTLAKVEFKATPIVRVKHFYGSGTKLSLQEEIIGMIVFDTRESSADATINAVGATWADVDSSVDYADLNAKFAALTSSGFKEAKKVDKPIESGVPIQPPGSGNLPEFAHQGGIQTNPMLNSGIPSMNTFLGAAPMASGYPQSIPTNGTIHSQYATSFN